MTAEDQSTALNLYEKHGLSLAAIGELMDRDEKTISTAVKHARDLLHANAGEYAQLHQIGARIAALNGDTRPSEWLLEKTGVVKDHREKGKGEGKGLVVQIGIALPGLGLEQGPRTVTMPAVAVRTEDDDENG